MNAFFETTNGFNFQIIDPLIESRGVRLTWFDCKIARLYDLDHITTTTTITTGYLQKFQDGLQILAVRG